MGAAGWSCFDLLVVSISLVSTGVDNVPGISVGLAFTHIFNTAIAYGPILRKAYDGRMHALVDQPMVRHCLSIKSPQHADTLSAWF